MPNPDTADLREQLAAERAAQGLATPPDDPRVAARLAAILDNWTDS